MDVRMTKVDLITGFLGSGKTTFLKRYARYFMDKGQHIGIIENDYGAVNVDMMLLSDLEGENCELEMVSGGCDADCHLRRFKTKLIALGMQGLDRVIIEPSGIYDVDEFFDVLNDEPLDRWYEIGSVITIVDSNLPDDMSDDSEYLLSSQISRAGSIVLSKVPGDACGEKTGSIKARLDASLASFGCDRIPDGKITAKNWNDLTGDDFARIASSGYKTHSIEKRNVTDEGAFKSLYFMNLDLGGEGLKEEIDKLFCDETFGKIMRVKGFFKDERGSWSQINATENEMRISPLSEGQNVIIVIGEKMNEEKITEFFDRFR